MYKVTIKEDILNFKNLPFEVIEIVRRTICLLDSVYSNKRDGASSEGGYVIVLTEGECINIL